MEEARTDIMQVCRNGHMINHSCIKYPHKNQDYCEKCGKETITKCPNCGQEIPGKTHYPSVNLRFRGKVPNYCRYCNEPYPWHKGVVKRKKQIRSSLPYVSKFIEWIIDTTSRFK